MTTLSDLSARVAALESGDATQGVIESLAVTDTPETLVFDVLSSQDVASANVYPAPIANETYRLTAAGVFTYNSSVSYVEFKLTFGASSAAKQLVFFSPPAVAENRLFVISAWYNINAAGASGSIDLASLIWISEAGGISPYGSPTGIQAGFPVMRADSSFASDLTDPFLTFTVAMGGLSTFNTVSTSQFNIERMRRAV